MRRRLAARTVTDEWGAPLGGGGNGTGAATAAAASVSVRNVDGGFGLSVGAIYTSTVPASEDAACAGRTLQITGVDFRFYTQKEGPPNQELTVRPAHVLLSDVPCVRP